MGTLVDKKYRMTRNYSSLKILCKEMLSRFNILCKEMLSRFNILCKEMLSHFNMSCVKNEMKDSVLILNQAICLYFHAKGTLPNGLTATGG